MTNEIDTERNELNTCYILATDGNIAQKISQTHEFMATGWHTGEGYSLGDIEKETVEIRQWPPMHWYTAEELKGLFEACNFEQIELRGDGLLIKLLLEKNERIVELMKKQPELFFEIESRIAPLISVDKAPTIIVKGLKR